MAIHRRILIFLTVIAFLLSACATPTVPDLPTQTPTDLPTSSPTSSPPVASWEPISVCMPAVMGSEAQITLTSTGLNMLVWTNPDLRLKAAAC
jgi:starvation-inducible outer membrane lipoprotein